MRRFISAALFAATLSTASLAETVTPSEVTFREGAVEQSLTGVPGDPTKGKKWFVGRKLGNCLACHTNSDVAHEGFHGEVGPPLDGAADRWTEAQLRGIVINSKMTFEGTIMPSFYKDSGYTRPLEKFDGKTILQAQQIEDIVAYLLTLKD